MLFVHKPCSYGVNGADDLSDYLHRKTLFHSIDSGMGVPLYVCAHAYCGDQPGKNTSHSTDKHTADLPYGYDCGFANHLTS